MIYAWRQSTIWKIIGRWRKDMWESYFEHTYFEWLLKKIKLTAYGGLHRKDLKYVKLFLTFCTQFAFPAFTASLSNSINCLDGSSFYWFELQPRLHKNIRHKPIISIFIIKISQLQADRWWGHQTYNQYLSLMYTYMADVTSQEYV